MNQKKKNKIKTQRENVAAVRREYISHTCGIVSGIRSQKSTCFRRIH